MPALLVLVTARRAGYLLAFLIAASAPGAVLLYRYVKVGDLGPLPNVYEPGGIGLRIINLTSATAASSATQP